MDTADLHMAQNLGLVFSPNIELVFLRRLSKSDESGAADIPNVKSLENMALKFNV